MRNSGIMLLLLWMTLTISGCGQGRNVGLPIQNKETTKQESETSLEKTEMIVIETGMPLAEVTASYINPEGSVLEKRMETPEGYTRIEAEPGSFASFLRNYPMKPDQSPVLLYDGNPKGNQSAHEAVFSMHIEPEDFQQCADSVMRIYAEYLYSIEAYDQIRFHLVNGFLFDFDTWRKGHTLVVEGNQTAWAAKASNDSTPDSLERYLHLLFAYASTLSMESESAPADLSHLRIGDIFIKGGSPGHVVMVADICQNEAGEQAFLLAQGFMPAQEFHVLKNPAGDESPWYLASEVTYPFVTPEYSFGEGSLRRPPYLD